MFGLLYAVMLVSSVGNSAMMSLFPAIGRESNIPDALIVSAQSVSALLSVVSSPYWAGQSDRRGRKPIILVGMAGFAIASLLTAIAVFAGVRHLLPPMAALVAIILSRCVFGTLGMASNPAIQAYVADNSSRQARTSMLASMASAQGFGSVIGPGLAPLLLLPVIGLAGPQLIFGVIGFAILAFVAIKLPPDRPKQVEHEHATSRQASRGLWKDPSVWPFLLYMAMMSACAAANLQTLGFVVIDTLKLDPIHAQPYAGGAIMAGAIGGLLVQLVVIRAFRLTPPVLLVVGGVLAVVGNLVMALASSFVVVTVAFAIANIGYAFARPGLMAGASLAARADRQGSVAGLLSGAGSSGLMVSPVLAMALYQVWPSGPFLMIALLMAAMLFLAATNPVMRGAKPEAQNP
jgi:MFS family permease